MIYIDTNYFLRFLLKDSEEQYQQAKKLILAGAEGKKKLLTSIIVIFEIYWVLSSYYGKNRSDIATTLQMILSLEFIELNGRSTLAETVDLFSTSNFDLEDCYHLTFAKNAGVADFKTFDRKLANEFSSRE